MHVPEFRYMRWAKEHSGGHPYDLTLSAAPPLPLAPVPHPELPRQKPTGDGDRILEGLIAARYGVEPADVLFVPGSTMGNFLLTSVLVSAGDRVLVEAPAYEDLPGLVRLLGATEVPLHRLPENGWLPDPDEAEAAFRSGVRLLLLTDLHNPTGVRMPADLLADLAERAARHGARILVDEVYRDFGPGPAGTAWLGAEGPVVVTSSLTKVYGLGPMRAGWILAAGEVRKNAARLLDYLTVLPPAPMAQAAEQALREAQSRQDAAREYVRPGRRLFAEWSASRPDLQCADDQTGVVAFPAFAGIERTGPLCEWLRREHGVAVVPGEFFGAPDRLRLAAGASVAVLSPALELLGAAVDRFRSGR
jgi:aspartate/methionine/tyrosine aminotransferase